MVNNINTSEVIKTMLEGESGTDKEVTIFDYTFLTSEKIYEDFLKWEERVKLPHDKKGVIGGEFSLVITETNIGLVIKMHHATGEVFDFTDYTCF